MSIIWQQRVKLLWTVWGYRPVLNISSIGFFKRIELLFRLLKIDWNIEHGHWPGEIIRAIKAIGEFPAEPGDVVIEAGCWKGGGTAKLSIICHWLGYRLLVFDSFAGVEPQPGNVFSGQYAASLESVQKNVTCYGAIDSCEFYPGWFKDTLGKNIVQNPIRLVYIDCDTAKGSSEVLQAILPKLKHEGVLCSQDYHIKEVYELLNNDNTWKSLGAQKPIALDQYRNLILFRNPNGD